MPPRMVPGPAGNTASKMIKKERIIQALSRMNDRDTQKAAAEDLLSILLNMDQEGLFIIVSCLCTTGSEHKVYARKECARAIGIIASEACPLREQALQQPHLGKLLGQLRRSLQDPDSGVREASSEALALVAQGLAYLDANGAQGSPNNPVVKLVFDCLAEQKKDLNAAACAALGMAAPYLGNLDTALSRELVRKLNSPSFQAPAALLAALARSDPTTGEPVGLMKSGPAAFMPFLSALVGQPAPPSVGASTSNLGSGVGAALSRPDWPVRMAAADMLRSTALLLGPLMEHDGCWTRGDAKSITGRAIRALETCKFDKVRDVRDVARNALAVLEELHAYGSGGGTLQGWPEHIARKLYGSDLRPPVATSTFVLPSFSEGAVPPGRKSPGRRSTTSPGRRPRSAQSQGSHAAVSSPPPPACSPNAPERRFSPMLARGGSVSERFRAAHRDGNVVSVHYLGAVASEPLLGSAGGEADNEVAQLQPQLHDEELAEPPMFRVAAQDDTLPDVAPGNRRLSRQASKASSENAKAAERLHSLEPSGALQGARVDFGASDELLRNMTLEDDATAVLDSNGPPTFSPHKIAEPPSTAELTAWATAAPFQPADFLFSAAGVSGTAPAPTAATPPPVPEVRSSTAAGPSVSIPVQEWLAAQQRLRSLEVQQRQLLESFNLMSEQNKQTIAGLQAKVRTLETALEAAQSQMAAQNQQQQEQDQPPEVDAEVSWMSRTIRPGSPIIPLLAPSRTTADGSAGPTPERTASGGTAAPVVATSTADLNDVRQAYREVLASGRLSDMPLLRLMQRTGPVWGDLGSELSAQLLAAFMASLQQARADGPLSRIMPWLWRLADEQNTVFEAPVEMRVPLLAALSNSQAAVTDPQLYARVLLLINTLRTHWALPDAQSPASNHRLYPQPLQQSHGQLPPSPPPPLRQSSPIVSSTQGASGGDTPQELSFGAGAARFVPTAVTTAAAPAAVVGGSNIGIGSESSRAQLVPTLTLIESQSPAKEASGMRTGTPRVAAVRSSQAGRSPSINTLMGQWSDLQRDFAAMSSPSQRPISRGQG
ncbi:hypothetical protein VaNZ11_013637 [Volvox africanus]|uniref:TOG domain-containing protein n=1 Tax=Volvox africanus TaxID=51714 RepID=A0ABQ5SGJ7_9CHLO|nr:hypothetical protein VaNZ11_013637 [Volvox africanus]